MNKIWYLSTCDTCKRIMKELGIDKENFELIDTQESKILGSNKSNKVLFEFIDIKNNPIDSTSLDIIKESLDCSYEDLFNKRAQKYTKTDLKANMKSEEDFRKSILEEYTFLKRPVIKINNNYFVGNSKKVVEEAKSSLK